MPDSHRLLERQLRRYFGAQFSVPEEWRGLLAAVADAYSDFDISRELLERSLVFSSQELHQANAEMQAVFQAIPDLLFRLDAQGVILDFKAGSSNDLLLADRTYPGKRFQGVPPRSLGVRLHEAIQYVLASKSKVSVEYVLPLHGQECVYEARLVPLFDSQIVVMIRNITERKRAEEELKAIHGHLLETSRLAGASEVAAGVLHNIGNALNSVNVSSTLLMERFQRSSRPALGKVVGLMQAHANDLPAFLTNDPQGSKLVPFLVALAAHWASEEQEVICELKLLNNHVDHIKEIVALHQNYAKVSGVREHLSVVELIEDALRLAAPATTGHQIRFVREFAETPPLLVEKHKVMEILVNLLNNAIHACEESECAEKQVTLRIVVAGLNIEVSIADNGIGILPANLTRIFNHGFAAQKNRRGFNLHNGALAAKSMGGSLTAYSAGPGQGATFVLQLPIEQA